MTTDPTPLQERIARAIYEAYENDLLTRPGHPGWEGEDDDTRRDHYRMAAAVLPTIRAAQADAWDEACQAFAWCRDNGPIEDALPYVAEHNPYETED